MKKLLMLGLFLSATLLQASGPPLIHQNDVTYSGAFRMPKNLAGQSDLDSPAYGGTAITYNQANQSLFIVGFTQFGKVAEISIPTVSSSPQVSGLTRSAYIQPFTDILAGKRQNVDGDKSNGVYIGGLLPTTNGMIVTAYNYYDGYGGQSKSHFLTGQDFKNLPTVQGPFTLKTLFRNPGAGFVGGYMMDVPKSWQSDLGPALTGQCCLSIVSRTSYGPSLSAFDPAELGVSTAISAIPLLGYPQAHTTVGGYGPVGSTAFYNGTMAMGGAIFPDDTSTILFVGRRGTRFCYGQGTSDKTLDLQPVPGYPGAVYCYDPADSSKGTHGFPYENFMAAYDANDLVTVKNGLKKPWDVVPYETWSFSLPYETTKIILGATYDPATKRMFISASNSDGWTNPVVHVFILDTKAPPPPPPPAPTPTATVSVDACAVSVTADTPDSTGGWSVEFVLDGTITPMPTTVKNGSHTLNAVWNKTGESTRTSPDVTIDCK